MDKEMEDWILAESYVNKELTGTALEAVIQRMQSDEEFAQLVAECEVILSGTSLALQEQIKEGLREIEEETPLLAAKTEHSLGAESTDDQDIEEAIEHRLEKIRTQAIEKLTEKEEENTTLWKRMGWRPIAAAVLLLIVAAGWWLLKPQPEYQRIARQYFEAPQSIKTLTRGDQNVFDRQLRIALDAYDQGRYGQARPVFEQFIEQNQYLPSRFYLAIIQLSTGEVEEAIDHLTYFKDNSDDIRFENTAYFLALAHLQAGHIEEAQRLLVQENNPKAVKLKKAIDQLQSKN